MYTVLATFCVALILLDLTALFLWIPAYFRRGVALFAESRPAFAPGAPIPSPEELEEALREAEWPDFVFRPLDDGSLAFRESWAWRPGLHTYTPVMHGRIDFDRERARVAVHGLANAFPFVFCLPLVAMPFLWPDPEVLPWHLLFIVLMVGLLGWLYRIQRRRFRRVVRVAAHLWSSASVQPS